MFNQKIKRVFTIFSSSERVIDLSKVFSQRVINCGVCRHDNKILSRHISPRISLNLASDTLFSYKPIDIEPCLLYTSYNRC